MAQNWQFGTHSGQTFVAVLCEAVSRTRWCRQLHRPDTSDADAAATGQCRQDESDVNRADIAQYRPQRTDAGKHGTVDRAAIACCQCEPAIYGTEKQSPQLSHLAAMSSC